MKRSSGPRKTASDLSESVHQQLNMHAIAAAAAGVGVALGPAFRGQDRLHSRAQTPSHPSALLPRS
jgi:hypothetical protein